MIGGLRTAFLASFIIVAIPGGFLGVLADRSTDAWRHDNLSNCPRQAERDEVPRWQESRLSALASVLAALATIGMLAATVYPLVRVLNYWLFEPGIRLIVLALISGPFFPLLRRRMPVATVVSSTIYGVVVLAMQLVVWPYPAATTPTLGFYYLLLLWIQYGFFLGLMLTHKGIWSSELSTKNRISQGFITLCSVLLLMLFVILRYRILPAPF